MGMRSGRMQSGTLWDEGRFGDPSGKGPLSRGSVRVHLGGVRPPILLQAVPGGPHCLRPHGNKTLPL
jgi:hypothetical protein